MSLVRTGAVCHFLVFRDEPLCPHCVCTGRRSHGRARAASLSVRVARLVARLRQVRAHRVSKISSPSPTTPCASLRFVAVPLTIARARSRSKSCFSARRNSRMGLGEVRHVCTRTWPSGLSHFLVRRRAGRAALLLVSTKILQPAGALRRRPRPPPRRSARASRGEGRARHTKRVRRRSRSRPIMASYGWAWQNTPTEYPGRRQT